LISRSDAAHNASVSSIAAARFHDLRIMVAHGVKARNATVMLGRFVHWVKVGRMKNPATVEDRSGGL